MNTLPTAPSRVPAGPELAAMLADVLAAMLGQEAEPTSEPIAAGPMTVATLAIHDELDDTHTCVELQVTLALARVLAGRMMLMADPSPEDILDAVAEVGNIAAGSAKSLLFEHSRLSLPSCEIRTQAPASRPEGAHQVRVMVLGHVVQLTVVPNTRPAGLLWPPVVTDELLGRPQ